MDVEVVYDAVAEPYAATLAAELDGKPFDRDLLDRLAERLTAGVVADVGCGPGHVGRYLAERDVEVVGVDLSTGMLEAARRLNPGMRLARMDVLALGVRDGAWAGAVAFYSLIHLEPDDLRRALTELRRAIRPDGVLCLALHGGAGRASTDDWFGRGVHIEATLWSLAAVRAAVAAAGFAIEEALNRPPYAHEHPTDRLYLTAGPASP